VSASIVSSGATTVRCSLDGGPAAPCGDSFTVAGLGDGAHTLNVAATDAVGNCAKADVTWLIDTTPPTLTVTGSLSPTKDPIVSATIAETGATAVTCRLDGGAAVACNRTFRASGLAEGAHTLAVVATDAVGNATIGSATWVIDTTAPLLTVDGSASPTSQTSVSAALVATGAATITCSLDGREPVACLGSFAASGLADGTHTLSVVATDATGNATVGSATWMVDTTAPTLTVSGPPVPTRDTDVLTEVRVAGATTVVCSLDGGEPAACGPTFSARGLREGAHTMTAIATDAVGNSTTASATWTIDTTPPTIAVTPPASPTTDKTATIAFLVRDAVETTCSVDRGTPAPCASSLTTAALGDGAHSLTVRATDAAGNSASDVTSWVVDTTAPRVAIVRPATPTSLGDGAATFDIGDAVSATCRLDAGGWVPCASPYTWSALADGAHTLAVTATDAAGNVGTSSAAWTVDAVPPVVTLDPPASSTGIVTLSATASDNLAVSRVDFLADGTLVGSDTTPPYSVSWDTRTLAPGASVVLTAKASDAAGNVDASPSVTVAIGSATSTTVRLTSPLDGSLVSGLVTVAAEVSDSSGIRRVEFFSTSILPFAVSTEPPYTATLDTKRMKVGTSLRLTVRAVNVGGTAGSASATVVVGAANRTGPAMPPVPDGDVAVARPEAPEDERGVK
jgi:archaellum component FlaF (FlaF/FlaG flagellin family)